MKDYENKINKNHNHFDFYFFLYRTIHIDMNTLSFTFEILSTVKIKSINMRKLRQMENDPLKSAQFARIYLLFLNR